MAKDIDASDVNKMVGKIKKRLDTNIKGAKAGYLSHDKGKKPYEDPDAPYLDKIALYNEFGTENIPARPFLRRAQEKVNKSAPVWLKTLMEGGDTLEQAMKKIGVRMQAEIKTQITRGSFTPNAPSTIARKGSSRPLVDTGNLLQSVHWGLSKKDGTETIES